MNISLNWANYALITGVCLLVYYLIIAFLYFRRNLTNDSRSEERQPFTFATTPGATVLGQEGFQKLNLVDHLTSEEELSTDHPFPKRVADVQDFVDEINAYTEAWRIDTTKEALREGLRNILYKYPSLKDSSLRGVFNGVIATACQHSCSIHWCEDELDALWNG